jgi:activator of HSP90 ATPase
MNLEVVPDHKIVQTWRASDWPEDAASIVTFEFFKARNGTRLVFLQTGVPAVHCESISQGWIDFYWNPMKEMLEK